MSVFHYGDSVVIDTDDSKFHLNGIKGDFVGWVHRDDCRQDLGSLIENPKIINFTSIDSRDLSHDHFVYIKTYTSRIPSPSSLKGLKLMYSQFKNIFAHAGKTMDPYDVYFGIGAKSIKLFGEQDTSTNNAESPNSEEQENYIVAANKTRDDIFRHMFGA